MEFNSNPLVNKIRYYFSFVMITVYLAIGLLFLFTDIVIRLFPENRTAIGVVFILYAVYRLYITIKKEKQRNELNE